MEYTVPKVGIITSVYASDTNGREDLLIRAYHSIINTAYSNFVWIVVDDGSTVELGKFKNVIAGNNDKRVILIRREKYADEIPGGSLGRNFAIDYIFENKETNEALSGLKYITNLDSDDEILDLHERVKLITRTDNVAFVTTSIEYMTHYPEISTEITKGIPSGLNERKQWRYAYVNGFPYGSTLIDWNFLLEVSSVNPKKGTAHGLWDPTIRYGEDRAAMWNCYKYLLKNKRIAINDPNIVSVRYHRHSGSESVEVDSSPELVAQLRADHARISKEYLTRFERFHRRLVKKLRSLHIRN